MTEGKPSHKNKLHWGSINNLVQYFKGNKKYSGEIDKMISRMKTNRTSKAEVRAWETSMAAIAKVFSRLDEKVIKGTKLLLEASFCTNERADMVLVGAKDGKPVMLIIENKQWSRMPEMVDFGKVIDEWHGNNVIDHPCIQVRWYKILYENANAYVMDNGVSIYTAVFLYNMPDGGPDKVKIPQKTEQEYDELIRNNPIFTKGRCDEFAEYISSLFDGGSYDGKDGYGIAKEIYTSEVRYSERMQKSTDRNLRIYPDEGMDTLSDRIKEAMGHGQKSIFIVETDPNLENEKTYSAGALLNYLRAGKKNGKVRYLPADKTKRKGLNLPQQLMSGDISGADCVICDRFEEWVIEKAKVSVFLCYKDSGQVTGEGSEEFIEKAEAAANKHGISPEYHQLGARGRVTYVNPDKGFAYIKGDDGREYRVSERVAACTENAGKVLFNGAKITFNARLYTIERRKESKIARDNAFDLTLAEDEET